MLAIALVLAAGFATLIMSVGSYQSLYETRSTYYDRHQFAHVFASAKRFPKHIVDRVAAFNGVSAAEGRIARLALLDIPKVDVPVTGYFVSLPDQGDASLNRLFMREGVLPIKGSAEVVIDESFAKAHGFAPGDRFTALLNGQKRELTVVGTAMSPEFIYAIAPGDIMPDPRRFGVLWMSEKTLAGAFDVEGAFTNLYVRIAKGAVEADILRSIDAVLDAYGGQAAYGRKDQTSHAFLDHELDMLRNMSRTLPPIFLLVSAFLVNLTISRFVALEREQIGLLKALGYSNSSVTGHYVKLVVLIVLVGVVIGSVAGTWLGVVITRLFGEFFRFPFLMFIRPPWLYFLATGLCASAALFGAAFALRQAFALSPAAAMQPASPPAYHEVLPARIRLLASVPVAMALRNIASHPVRAVLTSIGLALATAILVVSLFTRETMEQLIDVTFFLADRQDASITFTDKRAMAAVRSIARFPGVLVAEPARVLPVRIRYGNVERRIVVTGRNADTDLNRIIDTGLQAVRPPESGIAISQMLGTILGAGVGDEVQLDLLDGSRRIVSLPVTALVEDYFGIHGTMTLTELSKLLWEEPTANTVNVLLDKNALSDFYDTLKATPFIAGVSLQWFALEKFRETLALLITTMASIYTGLAATIAFGVVYNSARISLSERAREIASLRVLGFTQAEVFRILLLELALLMIVAQGLGWAFGYGLAWIMRNNLAGELMRVRLSVENQTYAIATAVIVLAAILSAFVVRARIATLDLVAVLKTRD